jgi:hypothetical protein
MTRDEQLQFVHALTDRVKDKVSGYILTNRIPPDWTGNQLRKFMADEMNIHKGVLSASELRNYNNEIIIRSL